jgi:hypothetical protein
MFYILWRGEGRVGVESNLLWLRPVLAYGSSPRWERWWVWSNRWNVWQGKPKYRRKLAPVPLCPPKIPHDLTRAAAVGSRRQTAWATARPLYTLNSTLVKTGKAIPVTDRGGPYGCETLRLPHFLDSRLTNAGEVNSLKRQPAFTQGKLLVFNSVREWIDWGATVWLEGLCQMKNPMT